MSNDLKDGPQIKCWNEDGGNKGTRSTFFGRHSEQGVQRALQHMLRDFKDAGLNLIRNKIPHTLISNSSNYVLP